MSGDNFVKFWLPLLFYALIILFLSILPGSTLPDVSLTGFDDKIIHFVEYAILTLFIFRLIINGKWQFGKIYCSALSFSLSSIYGMLNEVLQMFVVDRSGDFLDFIADMLGSAMMVLVIKRGLFFKSFHSKCPPADF